jgi:[acyl-carrier-protein] S-malonyltransferase
LKQPSIPVYANLTAKPYGESIAETLSAQACNPVRWQQTLETLKEAGADTFIEVGCGKTLAGLVKKTLTDVRIFNVENAETLQAVLEALR